MKSSVKCILCFIAVIPIGFSLISCTGDKAPSKEVASPSSEPSGVTGERRKSIDASKKAIAAKVNGIPISRFDLLGEMSAIAPQYITPGKVNDPKMEEKIRKEALDRLIDRELAAQEAKREGMKPPAGAVEEELKRIKAEMKTEDAFRQNLIKTGITEEELKKRLERNILVEMITEKEIFGKATVDLNEAKKIYAKKKKFYKGPAGPLSFEEARPLIEMELKTAAVQKREDEWVEEIKKRARIEIFP